MNSAIQEIVQNIYMKYLTWSFFLQNQHNLLSSKHKDRVTLNEKKFMTAINDYMNKRGTPIGRIPSLGFKQCKWDNKACHSGGYFWDCCVI